MNQRCSDCMNWRPVGEFDSKRTGVRKHCANCAAVARKRYLEYEKDRRAELANVPEVREKARKWQQANRAKRNAQARLRYAQNPEPMREMCRSWKKRNRQKVTQYAVDRYRTDSRHRLANCISRSIRKSLKHRGGSKGKARTLALLPFTIEQLIAHLEAKFLPGMTWDNYGKWHIDHRKPDCLFQYSSAYDDGFRESWDLSNLQPLWAGDNLKKGRRYEEKEVQQG